jgi:hypothetical protein
MSYRPKPQAARRLLPIIALLACFEAHGEIRPSFELEACAWAATDIVIASEGDHIDGQLQVQKVLAGALKKGDALEIPELAEFRTGEKRTVLPQWYQDTGGDAPRVLTGQTLSLFLKRGGPEGQTWSPAASFGGMDVSILWLEEDAAYGFTQVINPGPAVLTRQEVSCEELEETVLEIVKNRMAVAACEAMEDPAARAKAAMVLVGSTDYRAQNNGFRVLGGCGQEALPHLRALLADGNRTHFYRTAVTAPARAEGTAALGQLQQLRSGVTAFVHAGGPAVVPELTAMVEAELAFWKTTAPTLQLQWWNNMDDKRLGALRERYGFVLTILHSLKELRSPDCRPAVTAFRDYWRSLPQLEDQSGLDQMSQACDAVLTALPDAGGGD